VVFFRPEQMHQ